MGVPLRGVSPGAQDARWVFKRQSLIRVDDRPYDVLHVACSSTGEERDYFFDISSYFGKP